MKSTNVGIIFVFTLLFSVSFSMASYGQFRSQEPSPYRNTGNIIKVNHEQKSSGLNNFFNMKMSQSYEATFSSFGGQYANINTFTNSFLFQFNPKMTGRLDLAFSHSPFGGTYPGMQQNSTQFYIRNAELNYKFSENSSISFSFQQAPASMLFNDYYYGGSAFNRGSWPY